MGAVRPFYTALILALMNVLVAFLVFVLATAFDNAVIEVLLFMMVLAPAGLAGYITVARPLLVVVGAYAILLGGVGIVFAFFMNAENWGFLGTAALFLLPAAASQAMACVVCYLLRGKRMR